jgi:ribose 5-phosphate isomerase B
MKLCVALGADHGGYTLKNELFARLQGTYRILDAGADKFDPTDDYPDFVIAVTQAVTSGQAERGILICGSGVGATIAANKVPGIRACLCHDTYSAHQGVEHDDMNVLCLGARVVGVELAVELVAAFLGARFVGEERHRRRLEKVLAIERQALQGKDRAARGGRNAG